MRRAFGGMSVKSSKTAMSTGGVGMNKVTSPKKRAAGSARASGGKIASPGRMGVGKGGGGGVGSKMSDAPPSAGDFRGGQTKSRKHKGDMAIPGGSY